MVKLGRRQGKRDSTEPPISSESHTMSGTGNARKGLSTRITISEGTTTTPFTPAKNTKQSKESVLDTTLGLEEISHCSTEEGNELVIITSAVVHNPDAAASAAEGGDVEEPPEAPKDTAGKNRTQDESDAKGRRMKYVFATVFALLVILVAGTVTATLLLTRNNDDASSSLESALHDSTLNPSTFDPSYEMTLDPSFSELLVFDDLSPSPTISPAPTSLPPTTAPTTAPTVEPTWNPSPAPTLTPTFRPSASASGFLALAFGIAPSPPDETPDEFDTLSFP